MLFSFDILVLTELQVDHGPLWTQSAVNQATISWEQFWDRETPREWNSCES